MPEIHREIKLICSRCGIEFYRVNEYSLLGYRQCFSCDLKMLEVVGRGDYWPDPDDPALRN